MVAISEWLPNPTGSDLAGEWIELWNDADSFVSLSGWTLRTSAGRTFTFSDETIGAGSFLVLPRAKTKLVLKNQDESLALSDGAGEIVSRSKFEGTAPEGKSFGRVGEELVFADPTPGSLNRIPELHLAAAETPPAASPLSGASDVGDAAFVLLVSSFLLALSLTFAVKQHAGLAHLFFKGD